VSSIVEVRILVITGKIRSDNDIYDYLYYEYDVFITNENNTALNIVHHQKIDLIIIDDECSKIDYKLLINQIKSIDYNILIMVITIIRSESDKYELFNSNIDEIIRKPVDVIEFDWRLKKLLKKTILKIK